MPILNRKYRIINIIVVLTIFIFIFKSVHNDWSKIFLYHAQIDYFNIFVGCVGLLVLYFLAGIIWWHILSRFEKKITMAAGLKIWLYSQLGKYLPGKGAGYVGRVYLCQNHGVASRHSISSSMVEFGLHMLSALILVAMVVPFIRNFSMAASLWLVALLVLLGLVLMHPVIFLHVINLPLTFFKKERIALNITYAEMIIYLFLFVLLQALLAVSFFFFARAFFPMPLYQAPFVGMAFIVSYLLGILGFLVPAGLVVREGALFISLKNIIPPAAVLPIVVFSRLWTVFADVTGGAIAFIIDRMSVKARGH